MMKKMVNTAVRDLEVFREILLQVLSSSRPYQELQYFVLGWRCLIEVWEILVALEGLEGLEVLGVKACKYTLYSSYIQF